MGIYLIKLKSYTFYSPTGYSFTCAGKDRHTVLNPGYDRGEMHLDIFSESTGPTQYFKDGYWKTKDDTVLLRPGTSDFEEIWKTVVELLSTSRRVIVEAPGTHMGVKHGFILRKSQIESSVIITIHLMDDLGRLKSPLHSKTPAMQVVENMEFIKEHFRLKLGTNIKAVIEQPSIFILT